MSVNIIDARGLVCPGPLILTKKALKDEDISGSFTIHIDRENPKTNIEKFLTDNKIIFRTEKKGNCYYIYVEKPKPELKR